MQAVIRSVDSAVPSKRMANDEFAAFLDTSDEWIYSHTGIKFRHVAAPEQATSDLALEACKKLLKKTKFPPEKIDLVILASLTSDFIGFPSSASIVQDGIGAKNAAAFDLQAGCTGFIYSLETARNFILGGGAKNVLVVGAETLSRISDPNDRNTCVLFGDGAGAVLVCADSGEPARGLLFSILHSDGSGAKWLDRPGGGSRHPFLSNGNNHSQYLQMDGRQVYNFAVKAVSEGILELLTAKGLSVNDITYIVPHQANARIIEAAAKRAKIPLEKFYVNIQEYANTSAASIPIALSEMVEKGLLKKGDLILTYGFGAGLTWGGNLIRW